MAKSIKGLLLKKGIISKGPDGLPNMDPDSALAQVIFVVTQVIYTALMSLHVGLLYSYYLASSIYFVIVFSVGVWNGASFYIEVGNHFASLHVPNAIRLQCSLHS